MWLQSAGAQALEASPAFEALRVLLALAAVCALALGVLRWLARRGVGQAVAGRAGRVQVLERLALDGQRALYVVRADTRLLLLGTGPGAAPTLIAELGAASATAARATPTETTGG
jgi:flagellar biogenesis protein FliO